MRKYDHAAIEKRWQKEWAKTGLYKTPDKAKGKKNHFLLVEFPYPSGNLHVGHWYAFAVPDMLARMMRMQGKNVLYPIGFDAFGLPAENAAIKNKLNPRTWTLGNIKYMKKQIASMGTSFDWSREVVTCDPSYYKWTQWLFLQLFKKELVHRKQTAANWCPKCKTVLANEQVVNGKCERCGTEVEQRQMLQWNVSITEYADRLVDDLKELDWPEQIKESQRNWIGRSEGAEIEFTLSNKDTIRVFTTRPDTLYGATYLVLAPEHPWVKQALTHKGLLKNEEEVLRYIEAAGKKSELERMADQKEKTGVLLKGVEAVNPATKEKIPVFVADYVLPHYGTGAIMAVPAHDDRDGEFANKFGLPIRQVIAPITRGKYERSDAVREGMSFLERNAVMCVVKHWEKDDYLCLQWNDHPDVRSFISGGIEKGEDPIEAGKREIREESGYKNAKFVRQIGGISYAEFYHQQKKTNIRAKFRYLYYELQNGDQDTVDPEETKKHQTLWHPKNKVYDFLSLIEKDAIWKRFIGEMKEEPFTGEGRLVNSQTFDHMPTGDARVAITDTFGRKKTTYKLRDWIVSRQRYWGVPIPVIHCEKCGPMPVPDKDLPVKLPEVTDYLPEGSGKSPLAKVKKWVSVKCPKCKGKAERETDTLDTFVDSSWYFLRYTDPKNKKKFADQKKMDAWMPVGLYSGGAEHTTMHLLYSRFWQKALYDLGLVKDKEPYTRRMNRSIILGPDGQKMSKSRGNVVDPDEVVKRLGTDTVRMYLAFIGPYNEVANYPWNPDGVVGVRRFLERVWRVQEVVGKKEVPALNPLLHKTIKKVSEDIPALKFNTAISQLMIFLNAVEKAGGIGRKQWEALIRLLAPFAPHLAEELWYLAGNKKSVHLQAWPAYDPKLLAEESMTLAIQINGKTRGEVTVSSDATKEAQEQAARAAVSSRLAGKPVRRSIVVPGRLVNFVVEE